jgi:hypothetical protein
MMTYAELAKTIGWMRREGVQGADDEVMRYATDWLELRERYGVTLALTSSHGAPVPGRVSMEREAQRIDRERTRTRVLSGYRVWVQVRDRMRFGNHEEPGVRIVFRPTDEPDSAGWQVVGAGEVDYEYDRLADEDTGLQSRTMSLHLPEEKRMDVRNTMGQLGAYVTVWPKRAEWDAWLERIALRCIGTPDADSYDPEVTLSDIVRSRGLNEHYARLLRRIAGTDRLPARKVGKTWLVRESAIERWLATKPRPGRQPATAAE